MEPARLKSIPLFTSLDNKELTLVARHADEVSVEAGRTLAREGDMASEFFVIEEGTATVTKEGEVLNRLGPGDFFGEIGLLETLKRTATVVADTPMRLIVMFGPEFRALEAEIDDLSACLRKAIDRRLGEQQR
jgi:CRP-like cAMP-binding protein